MSERNHVVSKEQDVYANNADQAVRSMDSGKKDQILRDFGEFKSYLGKRIELAQNLGLGEEKLAAIAQRVAGYLAEHEEPRNSEEYLLKELWKVGTEEERHKLAHMLVKLAGSAQ